MSLRRTDSRQWSFPAEVHALVSVVERLHGPRLRADALRRFRAADDQAVGEAWSEVLFSLSALWIAGRLTRDVRPGMLWNMLCLHMRRQAQYRDQRYRVGMCSRCERWWVVQRAPQRGDVAAAGWLEGFVEGLTDRQREVALMLSAGTSVGEAARLLGIGRDALREHRAAIRRKLQAAGHSGRGAWQARGVSEGTPARREFEGSPQSSAGAQSPCR